MYTYIGWSFALSSGAMEALRSLLALTWPLLMLILTQVALVEGHPPPPPATGGNFSTKSQRQHQHCQITIQSLIHIIFVYTLEDKGPSGSRLLVGGLLSLDL